jgi:RNA polymerase sigma factor (sigma-70 family)
VTREPASREPAGDDALLAGIAADDAAALEALLARYWTPVVGYLVRSVGLATDDAADVAQDTFCRLWERRRAWRAEGSVRGLLFRLARNAAISEHRSSQARARAASGLAESLGAGAVQPPDAAERGELRSTLERAIALLPPRRREVFLLRCVHELSYKEIAGVMGTSTQTVANQLSSALATLRELLHEAD